MQRARPHGGARIRGLLTLTLTLILTLTLTLTLNLTLTLTLTLALALALTLTLTQVWPSEQRVRVSLNGQQLSTASLGFVRVGSPG